MLIRRRADNTSIDWHGRHSITQHAKCYVRPITPHISEFRRLILQQTSKHHACERRAPPHLATAMCPSWAANINGVHPLGFPSSMLIKPLDSRVSARSAKPWYAASWSSFSAPRGHCCCSPTVGSSSPESSEMMAMVNRQREGTRERRLDLLSSPLLSALLHLALVIESPRWNQIV